jgi:hypothetical protein
MIAQAVNYSPVTDQHAQGYERVVPDYANDDVARQVTRIIMSYTQMVNRVVWAR